MSESLFSTYYLVKTKTSQNYSPAYFELRCMQKTQIIQYHETDLINYERQVRQNIRHRYLINIVATFQDYDCLFLVTEMAKGGYLYHYLRSYTYFSKSIVQFYVAEMLIAIQYLHKNKRLYNLLMPDNIMLSNDGHIKLRYDFCNVNGMNRENYEKNIEYISIDYLNDMNVNYASDYWCLGIIMYEMLFGITPFQGVKLEDVVDNMKNKRIRFLKNVDESTHELLSILLDKHAFRRIGNNEEEAKLIRKCAFFKGIDWDLMERGLMKSPLEVKNMVDSYKNGINMSQKFSNYFDKKDNDGYGETFVDYSVAECGAITYCMDLESK